MQQIFNMLAEHLKRVPAERIAEGMHRRHVNKHRQEKVTAARHAMSEFLIAIEKHEYDVAKTFCIPTSPSTPADYDRIHDAIIGGTDITFEPEKLDDSVCELTVTFKHKSGQTIRMVLQTQLEEEQWRVSYCDFEPLPGGSI